MKKLTLILACGTLAFGTVSCSDDDSSKTDVNGNATAVTNNMKSGTWKITSFVEDGNDETNHFTGYDFTFATNGTVTAANGTNSYTGSWSVLDDNSNDDDNSGSDVDFLLAFTDPEEFADLSDDWDVQERTGTRIKLIDVSGGNGGTDTLVFEKNK